MSKVTVMSDKATHLILRCEVCDEERTLWTEDIEGGWSWQAATSIADEFDQFHDEECEHGSS